MPPTCSHRPLVCAAFGLVLAGVAAPARAVEIHSLIDEQCRIHTGLLIQIDDTTVRFVALGGGSGEVRRDEVTALVIHKTLENPFAHLALAGPPRALLRQVWLTGDAWPAFAGWPIGFYDDLFIFFDTDGKTHVLDRADIRRLRPPPADFPGLSQPGASAPVSLDFPRELLSCDPHAPPGALRPSRVIGDRIKVSDYFSKLADHFRDVESFEERTHVYARPFLFDQLMRLGLAYYADSRTVMPLYFQWANGRPYRFQSQTAIGWLRVPWVPTLEPMLALRSDVKSHFFTGSFAGSALSLAAGSSPYDSALYRPPGRRRAVQHYFNYLVLMGADYGAWSLSGGYFYGVTRIQIEGRYDRVVLADRASPTARLMYLRGPLRLRALYYYTRQDRDTARTLNFDPAHFEPGEPITDPVTYDFKETWRYRLAVDAVRAGIDWDLTPEIRFSADEIVSFVRYRELDGIPFAFRATEVSTALAASQRFGTYVAVSGYLDLYYDLQSLEGGSTTAGFRRRLGGAIEFLF